MSSVTYGQEPAPEEPNVRWCIVVRSSDQILYEMVRDNLRPGSQYYWRDLVCEVVCVRVNDVYCTIWCKPLPGVL